MREVADGVFEVRTGYVNLHLVMLDEGVVLVDTGIPRRVPRILQAISEARRTVGDVTTILLTHHHVDHVGNVAEMRRRTGARVCAHQDDAGLISGAVTPPTSMLQRLSTWLLGSAEHVPVDTVITVAGGPVDLPGFQAIHTPGHTLGHTSYLLDRDGGVLFAGDAAAGMGRLKVSRPPRMMSVDLDLARSSIARLAEERFDTAVFGHGTAVQGGAVERFRALASG